MRSIADRSIFFMAIAAFPVKEGLKRGPAFVQAQGDEAPLRHFQ